MGEPRLVWRPLQAWLRLQKFHLPKKCEIFHRNEAAAHSLWARRCFLSVCLVGEGQGQATAGRVGAPPSSSKRETETDGAAEEREVCVCVCVLSVNTDASSQTHLTDDGQIVSLLFAGRVSLRIESRKKTIHYGNEMKTKIHPTLK